MQSGTVKLDVVSKEIPLDRLADLAGISTEYRDVWGKRRKVPEAAKRALLSALGFDAQTAEGLDVAIKSMAEESWRRPLEPVVVVRRSSAAKSDALGFLL